MTKLQRSSENVWDSPPRDDRIFTRRGGHAEHEQSVGEILQPAGRCQHSKHPLSCRREEVAPAGNTTLSPECGVARFLALLNGPWATLVVRELLPGPRRFTELREALPGISPHTLTSRLRQFESYGIVTRTTYAEIPPRVEYALTPLGEGLRDVLEAMGTWAMAVPDPGAGATV